MRFLTDQDVYAATVRFLSGLGHDVVPAAQLGPGVIYLRVLPSTLNPVHAELGRVLTLYSEQELQGSFVVIEPARHRIRRVGFGSGA